MPDSLEESRRQLLEAAADQVGRTVGDVETLLRRYFRHVPTEDLLEWRPDDLVGAALSHRGLAQEREAELASVRVFTPRVATDGWSTGHTVVEIVTDDMPFLVDSVTAELARQHRMIHLLVHPQVLVRRDETGSLTEVVDVDADMAQRPEGLTGESWMHVQIDRESDDGQCAALQERLLSILADVRVAVTDWPRMRARAQDISAELVADPPAGLDPDDVAEGRALLEWLASDQFTFIGYREYLLHAGEHGDHLRAVAGSGLGILRRDLRGGASGEERLPEEVARKAREKELYLVTKANSRSTVHRSAHLDYIGIKIFDDQGAVVGERRFLGLFTANAYTWSVINVPFVAEKVRQIIEASGFAPDSHLAKDLLGVLETYPRDELFQADVAHLTATTVSVVTLRERRRTRLFLRRDGYGRFMSCIVYLPRDRYNTAVRLRMQHLLQEALGGREVEYTTRVSESSLARLYFVVRVGRGGRLREVDPGELERRLVEATRTWDEDFVDAARAEYGEERAGQLVAAYGRAFPGGYREDFHARVAVADLRRVEDLRQTGDYRLNLYRAPGAPAEERRLKLYRRGALSLSDILPVFTDLGITVTDERPYELRRADGVAVLIYDLGLRAADAAWWGQGREARRSFQDAFEAVWDREAESDGFNALVLTAGLTWRQVVVIRTVAKYLRQSGFTFSQHYLQAALRSNPDLARLLVELFEVRFDPDASGERRAAQARVETQIEEALEAVASLDEDRIVSAFRDVICATLRTNFYRHGVDGRPYPAAVSLKLDPTAIPGLPEPRPKYEIWVYGLRVEGVHLRFGDVARGGLRWSDRREDFRTEILGLVKAQMVKNAVIVPTGSKGGFVAKQLPDPGDRDAWLAEGVACYQTFIRSLLDVTDNRVGGEIVAPERVVRHDGDDPYLVVAADKGSAAFSDIANEVAQSCRFWLDDAFASGGSAGYDHKAMGITARGAWESVKRHFRELGTDTQKEEFTVVGIGDMSGDVFGNGMLLSPHIRLVAAFDHRHVFVDPEPDAPSAYAERRRLFELPRSSWDDYDRALLSEGGGVFPRTAKSIHLTPQIRAALGLGDDVEVLTPSELMRAVLLAPVDLLWNGGIGTYVKASSESNAEIGDRANDAIRVDGSGLRCRVIGEGGNLGMSQLGRIEAALRGVRVNTDAIDNSAGVDTSDHEVNVKILLNALIRDDDLTLKQRNEILARMTDDVAAAVLRDNYEQNVLLGNARAQEGRMALVHQRFMAWLEQHGGLDRALEFLPDDATLAQRMETGRGLTSPEFAVLVAYAKLALKRELQRGGLADEPWFHQSLSQYFPPLIRESFPERLAEHPLRREIIVNSVANSMINRGGVTFVYRAMEETGATQEQVARAFVVAREVFDLASFVASVEELDNVVPTEVQSELYLVFRRLLDRAVRWFLQNRPSVLDVSTEIERFRATARALGEGLSGLLRGQEAMRMHATVERLVGQGVPQEMAERVGTLLDCYSALDIVELAEVTKRTAAQVAPLYFVVSEHFGIDDLLTRVAHLPRQDRWDALARAATRDDLYAVLEALTRVVMEATDEVQAAPEERLEAWLSDNTAALERTRSTLSGITDVDEPSIATLSVGLRALRGLARSGSAVT